MFKVPVPLCNEISATTRVVESELQGVGGFWVGSDS